ncbi:MAG: uroporphyrinogen decarboxylase family protein, partial [Candidatus Margulisiibacteriota bacterium]
GQSSKEFIKIKSFMYQQEPAFNTLMEKLSHALVDYIELQIQSGAEVIQLFDTFGGILSPSDYQRYCLAPTRQIFSRLKERFPETPLIYFVKAGRNMYSLIADFPIDGLGVDWMTPLSEATTLPFVVQGNLDPMVLFSNKSVIDREVARIKAEGKHAKGHIFNLGHGILPQTPLENVEYLCEAVRGLG